MLARPRNWPYLNATGRQTVVDTALRLLRSDGREMAHPLVTPQPMHATLPRKLARAIVTAATGLGSAILLGALVLWVHYGTAVFFEMIASGISACF